MSKILSETMSEKESRGYKNILPAKKQNLLPMFGNTWYFN
jgi:hypothetical protein